MTDAELDAIARALTERPDPMTAEVLPPLPTAEVLAGLLWSVSGSALDLWTLRESIEAHEPHTDFALALLPGIAEHLDAACERLQAVAGTLGIVLPVESPLFDR